MTRLHPARLACLAAVVLLAACSQARTEADDRAKTHAFVQLSPAAERVLREGAMGCEREAGGAG